MIVDAAIVQSINDALSDEYRYSSLIRPVVPKVVTHIGQIATYPIGLTSEL